jgi:AraC family transcriptional regulator
MTQAAKGSPLPWRVHVRRLACPAGRVSSTTDHHRAFLVEAGGPVTGAIRRQDRWVRFSVGADDLVLVAAGVSDEVRLDHPADALEVTIDPQAASRFLLERLHVFELTAELDRTRTVHHPELAGLARRIAALDDGPALGADLMREALGTLFLATFVRDLGRPEGPAPAAGFGVDRFDRLVRFVKANLHRRLRASEIAEAVGMSETTLRRKIRAATGGGVVALTNRLRAGEARALIRRGDKSLAEVAFVCGYADQAHLTRSFRRAFGQSPGAWRDALVSVEERGGAFER